MLDNREIAILVWLAVFLLWAFSITGVCKAAVGVVRAALVWRIVLSVAMMVTYVTFSRREVPLAATWATFSGDRFVIRSTFSGAQSCGCCLADRTYLRVVDTAQDWATDSLVC